MEKTGGGAAPTGCYKCGRPGHWSRDCPSQATTNNCNKAYVKTSPQNRGFKSTGSTSKPKRAPRSSRPKLTPDLLISDNRGLAYMLRYFPRAFKFRGRGHEVNDLGHLLGMYADWHSQLIPYYPFDQFVHKVEQVCATKHFKVCIKQLREKVAGGGDLTKLHEPQVQQEASPNDQDAIDLEQPNVESAKALDELLHDVSEKEPSLAIHSDEIVTTAGNKEPARNMPFVEAARSSRVIQPSEEQKARMEANRLKAMEIAAARGRLRTQSQA